MMENSSGLPALQEDGNSSTELEALTPAQWASSGGFQAGSTTTLDYAMDLSTTDSSATPSVNQIKTLYSEGLIW